MSDAAASSRLSCPIVRTHQRFLLRELECSRQYAPTYRCRLEQQHQRVMRSIHDELQGRHRSHRLCLTRTATAAEQMKKEREDPPEKRIRHESNHSPPFPGPREPCRIIDLRVGTPAIVVGVTYKQMKLLPQFLKEYQKELLRLDAGGSEGSDDDNDADADGMGEVEEAALNAVEDVSPVATTGEGDEQNPYVCSPSDALVLEDSSGRITLLSAGDAAALEPGRFCTGLVMAVYGTLRADGAFLVEHYALGGLEDLYAAPEFPLVTSPEAAAGPCYVAFLSGLAIDVEVSPQEDLQLRLLLDFLGGNMGCHDPGLMDLARRVSRVVIGGNLLALTEEMKLKKKVKLEPPDHERLKTNKRDVVCAPASIMTRSVDEILARIAETVEVEVLPGDKDMSNAFLPQQPLHPILLPKASRYSTLRLVTNPFEFTALGRHARASEPSASSGKSGSESVGKGVHFFVTAGQNITDVARQTMFASRLEVLELVLDSGCACPTAPNTLWSYPFPDNEEPFLFSRCPHCVVACEQPAFETGWMSLEKNAGAAAAGEKSEEEEAKMEIHTAAGPSIAPGAGIRLVCVPSFVKTGMLVLVDVNSTTLETKTIDFSSLK
eukprot:gene13449-9260_t